MSRYSVIVTRDITESTVVEVEVETLEQVEAAALAKLFESADTEWELDEGSWNTGGAYVTGVDEFP